MDVHSAERRLVVVSNLHRVAWGKVAHEAALHLPCDGLRGAVENSKPPAMDRGELRRILNVEEAWLRYDEEMNLALGVRVVDAAVAGGFQKDSFLTACIPHGANV